MEREPFRVGEYVAVHNNGLVIRCDKFYSSKEYIAADRSIKCAFRIIKTKKQTP